MNAWKIVCATLVIFIAGIITGASLVRFAQGGAKPWRIRQPVAEMNHSQPGANRPNNPDRPENPNRRSGPEFGNPDGQQPGPLNRQFVMGLDRQLKLTSEQRTKIEKLMLEGQERIREIRSKLEPEMRKEMQGVNEQIKTILTPEQREQFELLMKQRFPIRSDQPNMPERRFREPRSGQGEPREPRGDQPPPPRPPEGESAPPNP